MNGFQLHNQQHTSASSINLWANAPDIWCAEKLFGHKQSAGPAAHRGIVIEKALVNILANGMEHKHAEEEAIKEFNRATALMSMEACEKERGIISGCISVGLDALAGQGKPLFETLGKQNKIELLCNGNGWSLPIIGYLDLVYPDQGLIIDIKTTTRAPSKMSAEHNRQAAIYRAASGNSVVKFLYITPSKAVWHECEDVKGTLAEIKEILNGQEEFLRNTTREELEQWVSGYQKMFGTGGRQRFNF